MPRLPPDPREASTGFGFPWVSARPSPNAVFSEFGDVIIPVLLAVFLFGAGIAALTKSGPYLVPFGILVGLLSLWGAWQVWPKREPQLVWVREDGEEDNEDDDPSTYFDAWIKAPDASGETAIAWLPDGKAAFFAVRDGIRSGRLRGEQVDHLTWRATVNRAEIKELMAEVYGPAGIYEVQHDGGLAHLADRLRSVRAFIAALPPDGEFTVTADEF
jgi:hypothetical protein